MFKSFCGFADANWLSWILDSRPWLCYWILHSIALLGESVDDELEKNAIDFLGRCQVRSFKFICFVCCLSQSWKFFWFSHPFFLIFCFKVHVFFFLFLLLSHESVHLVLSLRSLIASQGSDGGYGGGPGQVSICLFFEKCVDHYLKWRLDRFILLDLYGVV